MKRWTAAIHTALLVLSAVSAAAAQAGAGRVLVLPFENKERVSRIYWLSEASSVLLADELSRLGLSPVARGERRSGFERLQLPASVALSQATMIKVGQLLGADEVVTGTLVLDGNDLVVTARMIRLDAGRATPTLTERGPLSDVMTIFERVAQRLRPDAKPSSAPAVRPPPAAFEAYIKGLVAETPASQVKFLQSATTVDPGYDAARVALWRAFTAQGEHERALDTVRGVGPASPLAGEAGLLAGLSELQRRNFDAAFKRLDALAASARGGAVFNALGVVQLRRSDVNDRGRASSYFYKAVEADRHDPDYCFNLGYAFLLERDPKRAVYWLRETVRRIPADADAHFLLGEALKADGAMEEADRERELASQLSADYATAAERKVSAQGDGIPRGLERLKESMGESAPGPVEAALADAEQRDQRELAAFQLDRGRRLFADRRDQEAIMELRRAVFLSPYLAEAHLLLGQLYVRAGRAREGIGELKIALWSEDSANGRVALAEAYVQVRDVEAARSELKRALALDPASESARALLARLGPGDPRAA